MPRKRHRSRGVPIRSPRISELPDPPPGRIGWPWTSESAQVPERRIDGSSWPRITVVTPSFNQGQYLEATVRSVLLQGYPDLEYIIADGGSIDRSVEIIRRYEPWLAYWVSDEDGGMYDAINKGFQKTTGDIMAWLNSDDMYQPDALWAVGEVFSDMKERVQWIMGASCFCTEDGRRCNPANVRPYSSRLIRKGLHDGERLPWIHQESTFWTHLLWEAVGKSLDASIREAGDFALWLRMSRHAELYALRHPVGAFRIHAAQKTATVLDQYRAEMNAILAREGVRSGVRRALGSPIGKRLLKHVARRFAEGPIIERNMQTGSWDVRWESC